MSRVHLTLATIILATLIAGSGCLGQNPHQEEQTPSWNLSPDGMIQFNLPPTTVKKQVLEEDEILTVTDLKFSGFAGDVHAILVCPKNPDVLLVWAPGANNPASGYLEYMKYYPQHGLGVLIIDVRGNGGTTSGYPMDIEKDADLFLQDQWPQFYLIATDMISARDFLESEYPDIPIYAVGDSNGARYAALAAGSDTEFSGYIGISTSGFHHAGDQYSSPIREFLLSIDPDVQVGNIPPRPVSLYHAPDDPIISFSEGKALAQSAGEKGEFIPFNGSHGVNREVDDSIITRLSESSR